MLKKICLIFFIVCILVGSFVGVANIVQITKSSKYITEIDNLPNDADAILVLGAYVKPDGRVSDMLKDRLDCSLNIYNAKKSKRFLLSGDHGKKDYDEVNNMRKYLQDNGISREAIFMDHAGFSTYESVYRARDIFQAKKIIIVSQEYHLYRAIYAARKLGLDAYGVKADRVIFSNYFKLREVAARVKDFVYVNFLKPDPTYLGDTIPISGDGRLTDDGM